MSKQQHTVENCVTKPTLDINVGVITQAGISIFWPAAVLLLPPWIRPYYHATTSNIFMLHAHFLNNSLFEKITDMNSYQWWPRDLHVIKEILTNYSEIDRVKV